ncbi:uncharacterized protein SPPG_04583 [Spizellomyces punctatus DAOM BR117]|uniref:Uncharacterized protein n=1 Tax=Spizellomyces punctatus (strain DAOM BR117) TaxID=645134 RepID=A0A0L0HGQ9_SPIPD|nr:uncharacterized protein SPPG_04583 [Spizellomyces punctatus DAOM BR117]KND00252.1 hypothetical protein SPPG_04583 [Spizellomyces punctatus DAOM BR117]|eukprot:XP_016608291.1 hypothetical protein SPPG_04583 [Spizellomyces punctatus DAOM BR117]
MASTQRFDRRGKATELLSKIENFERRDQIEDLLDKLEINDGNRNRQQKSTFRDTRTVSMPVDVVAELLLAFAGRDGLKGDRDTFERFEGRRDHYEDYTGRDRTGLLRQLLEMTLDDDQFSGHRNNDTRRILLEVILKHVLREGWQGDRQRGAGYGGHHDDIEDRIREYLGGSRRTEDRMGSRHHAGSRLLERFLDMIEQAQDNGQDQDQDLDRVLMRIVLEALFEDGFSDRNRRDNDNQEYSEIMSMLVRRIMMHLLNDVESARMELEILTHIMGRPARRGRSERRSGWGLMNMIREHLRDFDTDTRRRLTEDNDIIRTILRLRSDEEIRDSEDLDVLIVQLLRSWCTDYLSEHKVRGNRRFRNLIEFVRELTSNPTNYMDGQQDYGRRLGRDIEEALRLQQLLERQGKSHSWTDRKFRGSKYEDEFQRRGERNSWSSGDLKEQLRHLFGRTSGFGLHGRDRMRNDGIYDRWM